VIVLDASALVELLLVSKRGRRIGERIFGTGETLHAPELIDVEVAQVLRRFARDATLSVARAEEALADLGQLRLERYPHLPLLGRAWELRENLTAYDAVYVALAELLEAPLLTCDAALARAPHRAQVELVR
jgi:predicted nucleic acid-binding protein